MPRRRNVRGNRAASNAARSEDRVWLLGGAARSSVLAIAARPGYEAPVVGPGGSFTFLLTGATWSFNVLNAVDGAGRWELEILTAIVEGPDVTQRALARRLGIALGLANPYLKRLAREGCVKVTTIPPHWVKYLVTARGIGQKRG